MTPRPASRAALLTALALAATLAPWRALADEPQKPTAPEANVAPPRCEVAVVNPVTNFAECVKPRGVPVPPPPPRPPPSAADCEKHADLAVPECEPAH